MSDFTEEEFNLAMAEMEGKTVSPQHKGGMNFNFYSDLNQLMPIAFKHDLLEGRIIEREFEDFIQSLRNDLWEKYLEGNSDE